jgi:hypothetical protein
MPDCQYGRGVLRLQIEKVDRANPALRERDVVWLEGVQLTSSGAEIGHRRVLVRGRRVPPPQRPPPGLIGRPRLVGRLAAKVHILLCVETLVRQRF